MLQYWLRHTDLPSTLAYWADKEIKRQRDTEKKKSYSVRYEYYPRYKLYSATLFSA